MKPNIKILKTNENAGTNSFDYDPIKKNRLFLYAVIELQSVAFSLIFKEIIFLLWF